MIYKILLIYIYKCCVFVGLDNKLNKLYTYLTFIGPCIVILFL